MQAQIKILNLSDKKTKAAELLSIRKKNLLDLDDVAQKVREFVFDFPLDRALLSPWLSLPQLHRDISSIRDNEITENLYKDTICNGRKNVVKLENRLDVITKRCGSVMAENAKLREIIDHMLQERSSFNIMWQRMINKLNHGKRHIMDLVEQASNTFDQRDELCSKLQILKERGSNDKQNHVQEMRELQRLLDHDVKLQEFLAIKGQMRLNTEQQEREADKRKKRTEEMEKQLGDYDKIFQRILVSSTAIW